MRLFHKKINALHIEIGKYILPVDYLVTVFQFDTDSSFNFYYYENEVKDYLLNENIITFEQENNGVIYYKFTDYEKLRSLRGVILGMMDLQRDELSRDFKLCKLDLDEV